MSGTQEHLEQVEHAGHGADPFTMRVAMTMAIIAALLAAVSLIGHRKHNEALQKQGDANRIHTQSAAFKVESSNSFAYYQAKRARVEQAKYAIEFAKLFAPVPHSDDVRKADIEEWTKYIKNNSNKKEDLKLDEAGFPVKTASGEEDNSPGALFVYGDKYKQLAKEREQEAEQKHKEYEHVHHQADGLDFAHLAVELGLVLCTISVLTRKSQFWIAGILAAAAGVGLAGHALFLIH
jgi:hypothetical protein